MDKEELIRILQTEEVVSSLVSMISGINDDHNIDTMSDQTYRIHMEMLPIMKRGFYYISHFVHVDNDYRARTGTSTLRWEMLQVFESLAINNLVLEYTQSTVTIITVDGIDHGDISVTLDFSRVLGIELIKKDSDFDKINVYHKVVGLCEDICGAQATPNNKLKLEIVTCYDSRQYILNGEVLNMKDRPELYGMFSIILRRDDSRHILLSYDGTQLEIYNNHHFSKAIYFLNDEYYTVNAGYDSSYRTLKAYDQCMHQLICVEEKLNG